MIIIIISSLTSWPSHFRRCPNGFSFICPSFSDGSCVNSNMVRSANFWLIQNRIQLHLARYQNEMSSLCFSGFSPSNSSAGQKRDGPIQGEEEVVVGFWQCRFYKSQHRAAACPMLQSSLKQWRFSNQLQGVLMSPQVRFLMFNVTFVTLAMSQSFVSSLCSPSNSCLL